MYSHSTVAAQGNRRVVSTAHSTRCTAHAAQHTSRSHSTQSQHSHSTFPDSHSIVTAHPSSHSRSTVTAGHTPAHLEQDKLVHEHPEGPDVGLGVVTAALEALR